MDKAIVDEPIPSAKKRPAKLRLFLLWCVFVLSLAGLGVTGFWASSGELGGVELEVFRRVNGFMPESALVTNAATVASFTSWIAVFTVIGLYFLRKYRFAWRFSVGMVVAFVITWIVEHLVQRERPPELLHDVIVRGVQGGYGFPSSHTATTVAAALLLVPILPRVWRWAPFVWIAAVGISRVVLGVHAPLDVVGGLMIGTGLVALYYILPNKFLAFFRLEREPVFRSKESGKIDQTASQSQKTVVEDPANGQDRKARQPRRKPTAKLQPVPAVAAGRSRQATAQRPKTMQRKPAMPKRASTPKPSAPVRPSGSPVRRSATRPKSAPKKLIQ